MYPVNRMTPDTVNRMLMLVNRMMTVVNTNINTRSVYIFSAAYLTMIKINKGKWGFPLTWGATVL